MHPNRLLYIKLHLLDCAILPNNNSVTNDVRSLSLSPWSPRQPKNATLTPPFLSSAAFVLGRKAFRSASRSASLGRYNFGFMWAALACLFLATILLCAGGAASRSSNTYSSRCTGGRTFYGRRKKSTRNRGSFIDKERERRISKDSD